MPRIAMLLLALLALPPTARPAPARATAPSPEAFFGYRMGAGDRLPTWDQTIAYLQAVAQASPRVRLDQIGTTTGGRPYLLAIISEPGTMGQLAEARSAQLRLADPDATTAAEAASLARRHKAVVVVAGGVHSTETGSPQALNELIWRLATDESDDTVHLLENLIVLVVPSQNPDGLQMVADWLALNAGTPYEEAPLPELYHPYACHDNNRDAFMQALVETRHLSRVLYRDWLPEVFLDLHQMGPSRARVFVPPYRSPSNPNVDPLVWSQANLLGQTMAARLQAEGKTGIVWGETYTGYWQGATSTTPWWHNIVGMLSEVASARPTRALLQDTARAAAGSLARPAGRPEGHPHLTAPPDVQYRMTYPEPWLGGPWTPRDVVEHHLLAAWGLLEGAASNRVMLKRNFHAMHRRTVERFRAGGPWAFAVPRAQRDRGAADRLLDAIEAGGARVEEMAGPGGGLQPGDAVIRLAQPFGRWVKDLLEPQIYPEPQPAVERPYDLTGWTLGLQMGVAVQRVDAPLDVPLRPRAAGRRQGRIHGDGTTLVILPDTVAAARLVNRLWALGASIGWADAAHQVDGVHVPPGAALATGLPRPVLDRAVGDSGLDVAAIGEGQSLQVSAGRPPRIALLEPWGGAIDAGWTRLVLEEHGFAATRVRPAHLADPAVATRFDVVVIPDVPTPHLVHGLQGASIRPEHRGGLGAAGVAALKRFVHQGGTIVTLGNAAEFAIDHLDVGAVIAARGDEADKSLVPGTLLRADVDTGHPVAWGLPAAISAMNVMNHAYAPGRQNGQIRPIVRYAAGPLVESGYARGAMSLQGHMAAFEARMGRGRVVVLGFRVQHRAQTWGTFRLLFNAIYLSAGRAPADPVTTLDD